MLKIKQALQFTQSEINTNKYTHIRFSTNFIHEVQKYCELSGIPYPEYCHNEITRITLLKRTNQCQVALYRLALDLRTHSTYEHWLDTHYVSLFIEAVDRPV